MTIEYKDFENVGIRVGKIIEVTDFKEARNPSYKLKIDFGKKIGVKKSAAQIVANYTKAQLKGKLIICVTEFAPKQIANFMSEVLVLGIEDNKGNITLLSPDSKDIELGSRIY